MHILYKNMRNISDLPCPYDVGYHVEAEKIMRLEDVKEMSQ